MKRSTTSIKKKTEPSLKKNLSSFSKKKNVATNFKKLSDNGGSVDDGSFSGFFDWMNLGDAGGVQTNNHGDWMHFEKALWQVSSDAGEPLCLCGFPMVRGQYGSLICKDRRMGCKLLVNEKGFKFFFPVKKNWLSLKRERNFCLCVPVCTRKHFMDEGEIDDDGDDEEMDEEDRRIKELKKSYEILSKAKKVHNDETTDIVGCPDSFLNINFGKKENTFGNLYISCTKCGDQNPRVMCLNNMPENYEFFKNLYRIDCYEEKMSSATYGHFLACMNSLDSFNEMEKEQHKNLPGKKGLKRGVLVSKGIKAFKSSSSTVPKSDIDEKLHAIREDCKKNDKLLHNDKLRKSVYKDDDAVANKKKKQEERRKNHSASQFIDDEAEEEQEEDEEKIKKKDKAFVEAMDEEEESEDEDDEEDIDEEDEEEEEVEVRPRSRRG